MDQNEAAPPPARFTPFPLYAGVSLLVLAIALGCHWIATRQSEQLLLIFPFLLSLMGWSFLVVAPNTASLPVQGDSWAASVAYVRWRFHVGWPLLTATSVGILSLFGAWLVQFIGPSATDALDVDTTLGSFAPAFVWMAESVIAFIATGIRIHRAHCKMNRDSIALRTDAGDVAESVSRDHKRRLADLEKRVAELEGRKES